MANLLSKTVTAASLKGQTENILNVFTKTVSSFREVSRKAQEEAEVKRKTIEELEAEREALEQVASDNNALADKFYTFLNNGTV
jgi:hypothetical protein